MTDYQQIPSMTLTQSDGATAGKLLRTAAEIVEGQRANTHGAKERSFEAIAYLWHAYLRVAGKGSIEITPIDVAQMMVLLKIARSQHGRAIADHFIDEAGYAAIAGEIAHVEL